MQSHRGEPRKTREKDAESGLEAASPLMGVHLSSPLIESLYVESPYELVLVFLWKEPVSPPRRLDHTLQN
jgi:hypothetical protein